MIDSYW